MHYGNPIVLSLAGLLAFSPAGNAGAHEQVTSVVTTETTYRAGAPEVQYIQRWLLENAAQVKDRMVGDPAQLGDVRIVRTASLSGSRISGSGDGPPAPLPPTGEPGDEITIRSASGGSAQSWAYAWVDGGTSGSWVLTAYKYERITADPR